MPGFLEEFVPAAQFPRLGTTSRDTCLWRRRRGRLRRRTGEVVEFSPKSGKELRRFEVGGGAVELLINRDQLVVACQASVSLYVIDLKKNTVVGNVQLTGKGPQGLFCSKTMNAYVYAFTPLDYNSQLLQIDLEKLAVRKRLNHPPRGNSRFSLADAESAVMSDDGRWMVTVPSASRGGGSALFGVDEEGFDFRYTTGRVSGSTTPPYGVVVGRGARQAREDGDSMLRVISRSGTIRPTTAAATNVAPTSKTTALNTRATPEETTRSFTTIATTPAAPTTIQAMSGTANTACVSQGNCTPMSSNIDSNDEMRNGISNESPARTTASTTEVTATRGRRLRARDSCSRRSAGIESL